MKGMEESKAYRLDVSKLWWEWYQWIIIHDFFQKTSIPHWKNFQWSSDKDKKQLYISLLSDQNGPDTWISAEGRPPQYKSFFATPRKLKVCRLGFKVCNKISTINNTMVFLLNHPNEHDVLVWQYFVIPDCKGNINSSFLTSLCHCGCKSPSPNQTMISNVVMLASPLKHQLVLLQYMLAAGSRTKRSPFFDSKTVKAGILDLIYIWGNTDF